TVIGPNRRVPGGLLVAAVHVGCEVVETLRTQEVAGLRVTDSANDPQVFVQLRMRGVRAEGKILAPAFGVETASNCDRLNQRGLAAAVLADEERHRRM